MRTLQTWSSPGALLAAMPLPAQDLDTDTAPATDAREAWGWLPTRRAEASRHSESTCKPIRQIPTLEKWSRKLSRA